MSEQNYNHLVATLQWFQVARPIPNEAHLHTQLGVHFEEVGEMLEQIKGTNPEIEMRLTNAYEAMRALSASLKGATGQIEIKDRHDMLDSLCDQIVTGVGVAHMLDLQIVPAMEEVNHSNYSKFVNGSPIFDENGKVKKGPGYVLANLHAFV